MYKIEKLVKSLEINAHVARWIYLPMDDVFSIVMPRGILSIGLIPLTSSPLIITQIVSLDPSATLTELLGKLTLTTCT